mmetsp:Transcript_1128/g.3488  ORF Transcript_1128/g.3488 Transcript_1128/m.3488 type:complete len:218 (-) Transcript_1128:82-735(-)
MRTSSVFAGVRWCSPLASVPPLRLLVAVPDVLSFLRVSSHLSLSLSLSLRQLSLRLRLRPLRFSLHLLGLVRFALCPPKIARTMTRSQPLVIHLIPRRRSPIPRRLRRHRARICKLPLMRLRRTVVHADVGDGPAQTTTTEDPTRRLFVAVQIEPAGTLVPRVLNSVVTPRRAIRSQVFVGMRTVLATPPNSPRVTLPTISRRTSRLLPRLRLRQVL